MIVVGGHLWYFLYLVDSTRTRLGQPPNCTQRARLSQASDELHQSTNGKHFMIDVHGITNAHPSAPCRVLIMGTDTEVGKTYVTATILHGLRALQRQVWLHKPIACGEWDGSQAGDGRALQQLAGDAQPPEWICPVQLAEACSPHLALGRSGQVFTLNQALEHLDRCLQGSHDCLIEGAGGILSPLTSDDASIADIACARQLPAILVTRPHLGTINHTRLSVAYLQQRGIEILGLIVNAHQPAEPSPAHDGIAEELQRLCRVPLLADLHHNALAQNPALGKGLARTILRRLEHRQP
ncbi:MAG: dethiobiotin synthase [Planctomycetota bacterium]|nr:MAG: dethiobiotin synthase [Planctomycetota bacterium]